MIIKHLNDFTRGWLIGDFEPTLLRTKDFEVGVLSHKAGEVWPEHIHMIAEEYNILLDGFMSVNDKNFSPGDVFVVRKGELAKPVFHTDCRVLVIKVPSVIGDKYIHEV